MLSVYTDLAMECRQQIESESVPGIESAVENYSRGISITRVRITSAEGEKAISKPQGNYVTIESPLLRMRDVQVEEETTRLLADEISHMAGSMNDNFTTMVIGLGNWNVTPDALGPKSVDRTMVTRHMHQYMPSQLDGRTRPVCALSPGVLGITGIETSDIVKGIVSEVRPDLVIAIDSLASRAVSRLATTIQLTDTGINPGSGLGSVRAGLSRESLGVTVIALGVPLVVYASTIARDIMSELAHSSGLGQDEYGEERIGKIIGESVSGETLNMVVTPKEIDVLVEDVSRIVAGGLNLSLHINVDLEFVRRFMH
ncbi:MAG: GPR endopeptidase [Christensenellales bacterium]|jgi:spore protease